MKTSYIFIIAFCVSFTLYGQTIWTGPDVTFEKEDFADWTLEENQDRITANVWITRADRFGIFNIAQEDAYDTDNFFSPIDTEWAFGTTDDLASLTFQPWDDIVDMPPQSVGQAMVVHLITDDIYIDLTFTSWTSGNGQGQTGGGGFAYTRSSDQSLGLNESEMSNQVVYPNPTDGLLNLSDLHGEELDYNILDLNGRSILSGTISLAIKDIDVRSLPAGIYILILENGKTLRFIKK